MRDCAILAAVEHRLGFLRAAAVAGDLVVRGVDIRVARAHGGIDFDAPSQAEFKPRLACERRFGRNADGEHDEIAFEDASICEGGRDRARLVRCGRLARVSCSTYTIRFAAVRVCGFVTKGTFVWRGYNGQVQAHQRSLSVKINHAILHILDFDSAVNVMSERELDFDTRAVRSFVSSHLRRARTSVDNRRASFSEESAFAGELKGYFFGDREFVDLSQQIAEFFGAELAKADKMESTDVLVADFDDDDDVRWFAVLLMASRTAFMHEVAREGGEVRNDIAKRYAILPGPSQKVSSYALVRASSMEAFYVDKKRKIMGEDTFIIPDGLLQCESGVSGKEVIEAVTRIVEEVAEEHGANTAVALAKAKAAVAEKVEVDEEIAPWDIAEDIFEEEPVLKERVEERVREERLPERVAVERAVVERAPVRNHKIRTDTGIEISFPAEMLKDTDYVQFVNEPNGLISIELRNIGSIENR